MRENYRRPYMVADVIVEKDDGIVLIKRGHDPFKNSWAFPAGFVEKGELVEEGAVREVKEETGLDVKLTGIIGVWSNPKRDPRGDVISVCFMAKAFDGEPKGGDDAKEAKVFSVEEVKELKLAFDLNEMFDAYLKLKRLN